MPEQIHIRCITAQGEAYYVILQLRDFQHLNDVNDGLGEVDIDGEERVEQILAFNPGKFARLERYNANGQCNDSPDGRVARVIFDEQGGVVQAIRIRNGEMNDSEQGEPAFRSYDKGRLQQVDRYRNGVFHDGANGEPASVEYYPGGNLRLIEHFKNGCYHDGPHGEPALMLYSEKGTLQQAEHYQCGMLHDGIHNEPAVCKYNAQGNLVFAERCQEGGTLIELDHSEINAYTRYRHRMTEHGGPSIF